MDRSRARFRLCLAAMALAVGLYALVVIRNFNGPIGDHSESFLSEYLPWYFSTHVRLWPVPRFDLVNDAVLYPFGTNGALQSWCVERELFYTMLTRALGVGPWLQLYYLTSLVVGTFGTFGLLRRDHGDVRATVVAILANVLNYYAAQKYPYHFNMAVIHWATLGIVCDFVLVGRAISGRVLTPAWLLLRVLLLVLTFGLELGHVLGFALTSLFSSSLFIVALYLARRLHADDRRAGLREAIAAWTRAARSEWQEIRGWVIALAGVTVGFAWLYGMLVFDVVKAARFYDFKGMPAGVWWSHPLRLLIPYFPFFHGSQQPRFLRVFDDQAETGIGSGGAGWFLLAAGLVGLIQARRHIARYVPLIVMFLVFVVSRPHFDLLRWMPWFAFLRVMSRSTVVYSTILALCALEFSWPTSRVVRSFGVALGVGLLGLELWTITSIKSTHIAHAYPPEFLAHMKRIESLPGEAVFDFPFCITGGNGPIGALCPIDQVRSVYALQRFHHKKVIGQYLGRLHPAQVKPFVDAGFPRVLLGDADTVIGSQRIERCPDKETFDFLAEFYERNNFAGIQLAVDRLPDGCAEQFFERFGKPIGEVSFSTAGRLAFIARDPSTFARIDTVLGKQVKLEGIDQLVLLDGSRNVLRSRRHRLELHVTGLHDAEVESETRLVSWGLAPETTLQFAVAGNRTLSVDARFWVPQRGQAVAVQLDGTTIANWNGILRSSTVDRSLTTPIASGAHTVRFRYALGNGPPDHVFPDDPRPLGVRFERLMIDVK